MREVPSCGVLFARMVGLHSFSFQPIKASFLHTIRVKKSSNAIVGFLSLVKRQIGPNISNSGEFYDQEFERAGKKIEDESAKTMLGLIIRMVVSSCSPMRL